MCVAPKHLAMHGILYMVAVSQLGKNYVILIIMLWPGIRFDIRCISGGMSSLKVRVMYRVLSVPQPQTRGVTCRARRHRAMVASLLASVCARKPHILGTMVRVCSAFSIISP